MSIEVRINGVAADRLAAYHAVFESLGPAPDESNGIFDIWTRRPLSASGRSVWMNPDDSSDLEDWLKAGGATLQSVATGEQIEDRLRERDREVAVRSSSDEPLNPVVLAAFLAHDFPLVDALMLARAFRRRGWPYDLSDYPLPINTPTCDMAFPEFTRNAGLYAVVPTRTWVRRLVEERVPVLQLRDKQTDMTNCERNIVSSIEEVEGSSTTLFINDHWQLAIKHRAYGVHLGQEDIGAANLDEIRKAGVRLGISTHGIYEMLRAHACRPSYMAMGAIFPTATKEMPTAPQGLRRLQHYVNLMSSHYPLVAIGGIDRSRIESVRATGVDCVAVLRAITEARDYRSAAAELVAALTATSFTAGVV